MYFNKLSYFIITFLVSLQLCAQEADTNKGCASIKFSCDTIPCEIDYVNGYPYNYLQIDYTDKIVVNKLNYFFFFVDHEQAFDFSVPKNIDYSELSFQNMLAQALDSLRNVCLLGELIRLKDHYYIVDYNAYDVLSIDHSWDVYNYPTTYNRSYTIDLKTGDNLDIDNVIKKEYQRVVCEMIRTEIDSSLIEQLEFNADYPEFAEALDEYKIEFNCNRMPKFIFTVEEDNYHGIKTDGIKFSFSYNYPWVAKSNEPAFNLFFSFDSLKPYLTADFKKRIFGDADE